MQEVEYVKQEAKLVYLLECLQKTAPPVLVFAEKTKDVDDVHEYLLVKGVEAVAVHGGKDQEDRNLAIDGFKGGRKDVLVATDVASKGLDFPDIQHVINFDMPEEIENYVHRYGQRSKVGKLWSLLTHCYVYSAYPRVCSLHHMNARSYCIVYNASDDGLMAPWH